jgi:hypothetical protein
MLRPQTVIVCDVSDCSGTMVPKLADRGEKFGIGRHFYCPITAAPCSATSVAMLATSVAMRPHGTLWAAVNIWKLKWRPMPKLSSPIGNFREPRLHLQHATNLRFTSNSYTYNSAYENSYFQIVNIVIMQT